MIMQDFEGRVAFVTGGARGIGYAIAEALLECGAKVMIADVNADTLADARKSLAEVGDVDATVCDVSKADEVARASEEVIRRFGKVHILVNNAGVVIGGAPGEIDLDDWRWIVDVNLMGVVYGVETFVPLIKSHGEGGFIVNTASMAGHGGMPGLAPYSATKFAVVGYSESLRQDLAEHGIGVAALCPGWVDTQIYESGFERPSRAGQERTAEDEATLEGARNFFSTGLPPRKVAQWVIESMKRDAGYIFTNRDLRGAIDQRADVLPRGLRCDTRVADLQSRGGGLICPLPGCCQTPVPSAIEFQHPRGILTQGQYVLLNRQFSSCTVSSQPVR